MSSKAKKDREAQCKVGQPNNDQLYQDCVLLVTGNDAERARAHQDLVALCSRFHQPGTDFFQTCISDQNIYNPMYSTDGWIRPFPLPEDFAPFYKQVGGLLLGLGVTLLLTTATVACEVCGAVLGGAVLSIDPAGTAFILPTALIQSAALTADVGLGVGSGLLTARALGADLEIAVLENQAVQVRLSDDAVKLLEDPP